MNIFLRISYLSVREPSQFTLLFVLPPFEKKAHTQKLRIITSFSLSLLSLSLCVSLFLWFRVLLPFLASSPTYLLYLLFGCDTDIYKSETISSSSSSVFFLPSFSGSIVQRVLNFLYRRRKRKPVVGAVEMASFNEENRAAPQREEPPFQNKYGGISPKKPLITKDHERAYFDSADWVLGKQAAGNSAKGPTEPLKPKTQPTAYHQLPPRRPSCSDLLSVNSRAK